MVALESSNADVLKVPSSVTIATGATTAHFTIDTSSVSASILVTIFARYQAVALRLEVTVPPPTSVASFVVTSPHYGSDSCALLSAQAFVCQLDASGSAGLLALFTWTLDVADNRLREVRTSSIVMPDNSTGCSFFDGASNSTDSSGRQYLSMLVSLEVEVREGR